MRLSSSLFACFVINQYIINPFVLYYSTPSNDYHQVLDSLFNEDFIKLFEATFIEGWKEKRESSIQESKLAGEHVTELLIKQASTLESIKTAGSTLVRKALEADFERLEAEIQSARGTRGSKEQDELNIKLAIKYAIYLMEHTEELLIDTDNPIQQGSLFALAFDELPRYDELINGTPKLSPVFALNTNQNVSKSELVSSLSHRWNPYSTVL